MFDLIVGKFFVVLRFVWIWKLVLEFFVFRSSLGKCSLDRWRLANFRVWSHLSIWVSEKRDGSIGISVKGLYGHGWSSQPLSPVNKCRFLRKPSTLCNYSLIFRFDSFHIVFRLFLNQKFIIIIKLAYFFFLLNMSCQNHIKSNFCTILRSIDLILKIFFRSRNLLRKQNVFDPFLHHKLLYKNVAASIHSHQTVTTYIVRFMRYLLQNVEQFRRFYFALIFNPENVFNCYFCLKFLSVFRIHSSFFVLL